MYYGMIKTTMNLKEHVTIHYSDERIFHGKHFGSLLNSLSNIQLLYQLRYTPKGDGEHWKSLFDEHHTLYHFFKSSSVLSNINTFNLTV